LKNLTAISITFLILILIPISVTAQLGNEFQIANRFMQQQNYEAALPLFEKLVEDNPQEFYFLERYIECFVQLKKYDEALKAITDLKPLPNVASQTKVLEGELYHFKGDKDKAYSIWDKNIDQNSRNLQIYISTSNVMSDLKEFQKAVEVLRKAREVFNNPQLFFNDISNTLLQSGNYEAAVQEWIDWLTVQPDQISNIQRSLLRFNDPLLNDITILEIDDKLNEISITNPAYSTLFRFQIWLLQENKLYRRALASATAFENSTSNLNYSLFQLGRSLRRNKEFELAVTAFEYYVERTQGNVKWQSQEELAKVYSEWAKQLDDFNVDFTDSKTSLYSKALEQLNLIISNAPNYRNLSNVLLLKSEIVLDNLHDINEAKNILATLRSINSENEIPEEFYIQGRIEIANKQFAQARISLTKSNKLAGIGELAEKTRYFLALTDFFSSDFEFATIQLKTLGRQNTSYYANDALELRLWIQEGLSADTTGKILTSFADAIFESLYGNYQTSGEKLLALMDNSSAQALYDNSLLLLSDNPTISTDTLLTLNENYLSINSYTPQREQLMWQRAKFALESFNKKAERSERSMNSKPKTPEEQFFNRNPVREITKSTVELYFEELILEFPQGFYAPYARKQLSELSKRNI
jgi:predicted negative regulator of RcsB-dependent stress response